MAEPGQDWKIAALMFLYLCASFFLELIKVKDDKYYMDVHRMWDRMMEYMDDRKRVYRFTDWGLSRGMEGICPTLLAAMGSRFERIPFFYDDYSVRLMTPRECARLQGFPDSFKIPVSDTQAYKQFGNSVVVPLMAGVAKLVVDKLGELDNATVVSEAGGMVG